MKTYTVVAKEKYSPGPYCDVHFDARNIQEAREHAKKNLDVLKGYCVKLAHPSYQKGGDYRGRKNRTQSANLP